ncbi:MAG: 16S rRNA (guanine(966)-N(2))-methyltransferase RsmD [Gemmatimonadota bacterium]
MRVIGGRLRGRPVRAVRAAGLRPTADRVREALFNLLGDAVMGARVLDLYAGTGALAVEALSRGALAATCVERDARVLAALAANVAALELTADVTVTRADALAFCRRVAANGTRFDLVLCDPPYATPLDPLARALVEQPWWERVCVVEHAASATWPAIGGGLERDTRRYGDTALSLFWRA